MGEEIHQGQASVVAVGDVIWPPSRQMRRRQNLTAERRLLAVGRDGADAPIYRALTTLVDDLMGWIRGRTHHPNPFRQTPQSLCFHAENALQTPCNPNGFNEIALRKHGAIQMPSPCNHEMTFCKPVDCSSAICNLHASSKFTSCLQSTAAVTDPGLVRLASLCSAVRYFGNG